MELNFRLWVESKGYRTGKLSLYPPLYTQYMNYCPQDVVTWNADAITYMDPEDVKFRVIDGPFQPYFWHGVYRGRTTSD